jgi:glycosyltransferase involved in cell wall biosynthesis
MRVVVSGWFWDAMSTGSGQYLAGLATWMPSEPGEPEFILVRHRKRRGPTVNRAGASVRATGRDDGRLNPGEPELALDPLRAAGANWRLIEAGTPFDFLHDNLAKVWFEQVTFPSVCRRLRADVALVPYWGSPWWRPCPMAVTIHDLIPLLLPPYRGGLLQGLYASLVSRTACRAAAVLTDSEASKRDIVAWLSIPATRVHAVHLAAGPEYRPVSDPEQLARVRARYDLPPGPFFIDLGGFDVRKNVKRVLEAYAQAVATPQPLAVMQTARRGQAQGGRAGLPDACGGDDRDADRPAHGADETPDLPLLVIAGKLPGRDSAFAPDPRPLVEQLGLRERVHFTGWVDEADKPALYSLATAALFVSEYEGFGLPVLEAQACGCPVITSAAY